MNEIFWILVGGVTGWLTGIVMGGQGYGKRSLGGYARSLDIALGMVGASFGGYLFFWAVMGEVAPLADMPSQSSAQELLWELFG